MNKDNMLLRTTNKASMVFATLLACMWLKKKDPFGPNLNFSLLQDDNWSLVQKLVIFFNHKIFSTSFWNDSRCIAAIVTFVALQTTWMIFLTHCIVDISAIFSSQQKLKTGILHIVFMVWKYTS